MRGVLVSAACSRKRNESLMSTVIDVTCAQSLLTCSNIGANGRLHASTRPIKLIYTVEEHVIEVAGF